MVFLIVDIIRLCRLATVNFKYMYNLNSEWLDRCLVTWVNSGFSASNFLTFLKLLTPNGERDSQSISNLFGTRINRVYKLNPKCSCQRIRSPQGLQRKVGFPILILCLNLRILNKERQALLEERRQILSGEDPILLEEVRFINEQMEEQKQMLINKMGVTIINISFVYPS